MATSKLANAINETTKAGVTDVEVFNDAVSTAGLDLEPYQAGSDFTPRGKSFTQKPKQLSDYLDSVAVKYANVFIKVAKVQNPLSRFKRGLIPYGGKLESVVFDTISPKVFRPDLVDGAENPFTQNFGRVVGHTYTTYFDIESTNTIQDTVDTIYFQNLTQFNTFVYGKIMQLVNGAMLDEFYNMKLTLAKPIADQMISTDTVTNIKDLGKKILEWSRKFKYFRRDSNYDRVNQATMVEDIEVIMPVKYSVDMDIDFLMNAFNPEIFRNTKVHVTEVDEIPDVWEYNKAHTVVQQDIDRGYVDKREHPVGSVIEQGAIARPNATDATKTLDGSKVGAIILDRDALQAWDSLPLTLSTINNPKKRYTNIFANQKTALMFVQSLNSKAIMCNFD